ncbi:MAG: galactose mutarotase [Azospirillaceae bacterium]|nr:galactose mutarotase [Azospirillaceae bacterium]
MKVWTGVTIVVAALAQAAVANAADARREAFGTMNDGGKPAPVESVVLSNGHGVSARVLAYGATLQSLVVPGRDGQGADVVLAYPDVAGYQAHPKYFGATVGRYANRIKEGRFTLDGKAYQLATNDGPNALHGGRQGYDKVLWTITEVKSGPAASVTLTHTSPDGDEGYPGALTVQVTYSLDEKNDLTIRYKATTDKPTVLNLTNHSLFNMAGAASGHTVLEQKLTVAAANYSPVSPTLIPDGGAKPVEGTPFDFRTPHLIGERIHDGRDPQLLITQGYDHNYVLDGGVTAEPRLAARFEDPASGRVMEILTTEPGLQVYSGNFLNGDVAGVGGYIYRQSDGLALEPQHFPDSPNRPDFPTTRLNPGQTYTQVSIYRFSTTAK